MVVLAFLVVVLALEADRAFLAYLVADLPLEVVPAFQASVVDLVVVLAFLVVDPALEVVDPALEVDPALVVGLAFLALVVDLPLEVVLVVDQAFRA